MEKMLRYNPKYLMYPHYGVVEKGGRILQNHLKQVKEYFNVAKNLGDDNKDLDAYLFVLSEKDRN